MSSMSWSYSNTDPELVELIPQLEDLKFDSGVSSGCAGQGGASVSDKEPAVSFLGGVNGVLCWELVELDDKL